MLPFPKSGKEKYKRGIFIPQNPQKYIGTQPIRYLSSWERKFYYWCDKMDSVIEWRFL